MDKNQASGWELNRVLFRQKSRVCIVSLDAHMHEKIQVTEIGSVQ